MSLGTAIALLLALASTTLVSLAYLREHDAVAAMPELSLRRPMESLRLLLANRRWMLAFAMESGGFLLYALALALASLALVQSVAAGGIGVLAYVSARLTRRRLSRRESLGVMVSIVGLVALAVSLAGGGHEGGEGSILAILLWLGATAAAAALMIVFGRRLVGTAAAYGIAGGLLFAFADISTKITTQGGLRVSFVVLLILGYMVGTAMLQVGYQAGAALTVAGLAVLLTNAVPIAAGTIVLSEPVPSGALGVLRVLSFAAVCAGAFLLARPDPRASAPEMADADEASEPIPEPARP